MRENLKNKQKIYIISWSIAAIFLLIYLVASIVFSGEVLFESTLYPYKSFYKALSFSAAYLSTSVAILLVVAGNILSPRKMIVIATSLYGCLAIVASVTFMLVRTPDDIEITFAHMLLEPPRIEESLWESYMENSFRESELKTPPGPRMIGSSICEQEIPNSLKYFSFEGDCRFSSVIISRQKLQNTYSITEFFSAYRSLSLLGNGEVEFISSENIDFVGMENGLRYFKFEPEFNLSYGISDYPVYLALDENNLLKRLTSCRLSQALGANGGICEHWVRTQRGTLVYDLKESTELDPDLWAEIDLALLNIPSELFVDH